MSDLDELYDALKDDYAVKEAGGCRTMREERIIAGFEEIEHFFKQQGRIPDHGEDRDIFERLYAIRLERIRASEECRALLGALDKYGLLRTDDTILDKDMAGIDDDTLLEELASFHNSDITTLTHIRPRAEVRMMGEIASRTSCPDFAKFKPLFDEVLADLKKGLRQSQPIRKESLKSRIQAGDFFILNGQMLHVAEKGRWIKGSNEARDARLRVIYANGTQSNILLDSLRRALYDDEAGRAISQPSAGPLFSGVFEYGDVETGTIYILRSHSDHPWIKENREIIHKIGVTTGDVKKRLGNTKVSATYLMAAVEIVATYELVQITPIILENLLHRFFKPAQPNIEIKDRFGNNIDPREWFLVPLFVIDEAIERIKDGSIVHCIYDVKKQKIRKKK